MVPCSRVRWGRSCRIGKPERAERNRRSLARLTNALPVPFPSAVLARALVRPFVPPTPRLAIDLYWSAHPVRADRLAPALAARSGAPTDWRWRLGNGQNGLPLSFRYHRRLIANLHSPKDLASAVCAGGRFIASAGMSISGIVAPTRMRSGTVPVWWRGNSGMRPAVRQSSCAACKHVAAARPAGVSGGMRKLTTGSRSFEFGRNIGTPPGRSCSAFGACQTFS